MNKKATPVELDVLPWMDQLSRPCLRSVNTNLLVLTKKLNSSMTLGHSAQTIDEALHGQITTRMHKEMFFGNLGDRFVIALNDVDRAVAANTVAVIGLGDPMRFDDRAASVFFDIALRMSVELGAKDLTIPIVAGRLPKSLTMYRCGQLLKLSTASATKIPSTLRTVKVFCHPQAAVHLKLGWRIHA